MRKPPIRYAITNLSGSVLDSPRARTARLGEQVRRWAVQGVDFVQLREKQLEAGELLELAQTAMGVLFELAQLQGGTRKTRLLVNGRPDAAAAARADGAHLTARPDEFRPSQARDVFAVTGLADCFVSVSCHSVEQIVAAREGGADLLLFGPVFEKWEGGKVVIPGSGLALLRAACVAAEPVPVLALGGITAQNSQACMDAGAAGFAAIRLFAAEPD